MTLIETYERPHLQNIAECLAIKPERLILVGNDANLESSKALYEKIFKKHDMKVQIIPKRISSTSFEDAKAVFEELIKCYSPCVIDLFGGEELHLVAAGAAFQQLKDHYAVSLQKMDVKQSRVVRVDGEHPVVECDRPELSIKESVQLCDGVVFSQETEKLKNYTSADVNPLWDIARKDPGKWNKKLKALNFFESRNDCDKDDLEVLVDIYCFCGTCADVEEKRYFFQEIMDELEQAEIITIKNKRNGFYRYRYKNDMVRTCLKKEGNILEYKTYFTVRECVVNGKHLFNDCAISVTLDWDGVLHNPYGPSPLDTRNEIDIMAMCGIVPVFISCKNGAIGDEELYKLNTVAMRLGGEYSRKALIATDFEPTSLTSKQSTIQRAKDMGVVFEPDAAAFSQADWNRFFEDLMK